MKIKNSICLLRTTAYGVLALFILLSNEISAFTVDTPITEPIHESITRDAFAGLPAFHQSSGQLITFSSQAITDIADSNRSADWVYKYNPERHFDKELFETGQLVLVGIRNAIVADLKSPTGNGAKARELLGGALHTLQDFYAHSTWVENGLGRTAPLGQAAVVIPFTTPTLSALCGDHQPIIPGSQLTSGFYDSLADLLSGSNYYSWLVTVSPNPPIKKCFHGAGHKCNDDGKCPLEDVDFNYSAGINKDTPVRRHHLAARIAATESTAEYLQLILADLGNDDAADLAKCKLMGQDCYHLFLTKDGTGTGVITASDPPANNVLQDCPFNCTLVFKGGTVVTLEAKAGPGFEFLGWGQDCSASGTTNPIQLTLSSVTLCKATFGVLPRVRLNPYGSKNLSEGPFYLELVDATFSPTTTTEDVTVTLLRQVFSNCRGLLFSSNRVVGISKSQSYSSDLSGYVAGRDPFCTALPIRTELTITSAILGSSKALNLTSIPAEQRKVAITR